MTHFPPATLGAALVPVGRTRSRLARWKRKLATSPATAKIAIVGDSTAEETNYPWPYSRLRTYWMQPGMALGGMQSANLIEGGNSGLSLQNWLGGSAVDFTPAALWAAAPDLAIFRFLTNDTRLGTRTQAQMTADVQTLIDLTTANLPGADIVLTVPPTFTTTVVGQDFLGGATLAQAQARADAMRAALLGFTDAYPHVLVLDSGGDVYAMTAPTRARRARRRPGRHPGRHREGRRPVRPARRVRARPPLPVQPSPPPSWPPSSPTACSPQRRRRLWGGVGAAVLAVPVTEGVRSQVYSPRTAAQLQAAA
jgi:lysophospholipase L1-like esterase